MLIKEVEKGCWKHTDMNLKVQTESVTLKDADCVYVSFQTE